MMKFYKKSVGFSLVELMVGISVGMIIISGVMILFGNTLRADRDVLASTRLNQDMSAVMSIMSNELRRAGSGDTVIWSAAGSAEEPIQVPNANCIIYRYDAGGATTGDPLDVGETRGFKLENGIVYMSRDGADADVACNAANTWDPLTDPNVVNVTAMTFYTTGSKCRNTSKGLWWEVTGATETGSVCAVGTTNVTCTDTKPLEAPACGGATTVPAAESVPVPPALPATWMATDDLIVAINHIEITLDGELANDATVTKELTASVRVANPRVQIVP